MQKLRNKIIGFSVILSFVITSSAKAQDYGLGATAGEITAGLDKSGNLPAKVGSLVGQVLAFTGSIFFLLVVYAGLTWMMAQGNQTQVDKAKKILGAAVIGLIVVMSAYVITSFIGSSVAAQ